MGFLKRISQKLGLRGKKTVTARLPEASVRIAEKRQKLEGVIEEYARAQSEAMRQGTANTQQFINYSQSVQEHINLLRAQIEQLKKVQKNEKRK